jgi:Xaa-Pro aminopeptidase
MIKNGTRYHKGSCANASRAFTWPPEKLDAHMRKMWEAAIAGRRAVVLRRLARIAPGVDAAIALRLWERGYKAGYRARRYRRHAHT